MLPNWCTYMFIAFRKVWKQPPVHSTWISCALGGCVLILCLLDFNSCCAWVLSNLYEWSSSCIPIMSTQHICRFSRLWHDAVLYNYVWLQYGLCTSVMFVHFWTCLSIALYHNICTANGHRLHVVLLFIIFK